MRLDLALERTLDSVASRVRRVDYTSVAVSALTGEVIAQIAGVPGKRHTLPNEPFDSLPAVFNDVAGNCGITKPRARYFRIANLIPTAPPSSSAPSTGCSESTSSLTADMMAK